MSTLDDKVRASGLDEDTGFQRSLRLEISRESYRGKREQAQEAGRQRSILALATLTSLGVVFTMHHYWKSGSGNGYDVLADFAPAAGILVCLAFHMIGRSRYREECSFTRSAIEDEVANGVWDGAAMIRARNLAFDKLWMPSRGAVSALCCGICVVVFGIVQFWS